MVPDPALIFRITHWENLSGIIRRNGIYAPNSNPRDGLAYKAIHHLSIQAQRANKIVPCGPRGVLHDYVPFYFAPRSPMLYAIHKGNVTGYDEGQEPVIYLVADARLIAAHGVGFVFTDGHAILELSEFHDDLRRLDKVDWRVMRLKYWFDTPQTPDRKRRRQAEFLVYRFLPWPLIHSIGVMNERMKSFVEEVLVRSSGSYRPIVEVKRGWYY